MKLAAIVLSSLIFAGGALADVSGSPLVDYGNLDTCSGCAFPYIQFTAANTGQTVTSYSFYDGQSSSSGTSLTPILFEQTATNPAMFKVIGIGASSTGFNASAINTESFTLVSGSATVLDANTFFGYLDGTLSGSTVMGNAGTISTTYPGNGGPGQYYISSGTLAVNQTVEASTFVGAGQATRTYALQVTTTPEPGLYGLLALALGGLGFAIRRRTTSHN